MSASLDSPPRAASPRALSAKSAAALLKEDMRRVDDRLLAALEGKRDLIPEVARHLIASGGKRLRPMVALASARLCGYQGDAHIDLAAAVEMMHSATLLHDDVVDEGALRRGRQAARLIWGNKASILVGDFLLGKAFDLMVGTQSLHALRILSAAACRIAEGEVMQLACQRRLETDEAACLEIAAAKTGALFAAAAQTGSALVKSARAHGARLETYGHQLGMAFQLSDDVLDYAGGSKKMGKALGNDLREGKMTLPVVLTYARGSEKERRFWQEIFANGLKKGFWDEARALMERHGALDETRDRAKRFSQKAVKALSTLPQGAGRDSLEEIALFSAARLH